MRDKMHRCPYCKKLWPDEDCILDPIKGYICPDGCVEPFIQPEYELPTNE